jgi:hypothetical protein
MITPRHASREFGVYQIENGKTVNLLVPIWNWGMFYEKMIEAIISLTVKNVFSKLDRQTYSLFSLTVFEEGKFMTQ